MTQPSIHREFAVLGYPLGHTMSPPIHTRLFELAGLPSGYQVFETPPEQLGSKIPQLLELTGFNVTIPHKQAIIPYLTRLDESAQRYGAVNTVRIQNGESVGYNTDVDGFLRTIQEMGLTLQGKSVCVLGPGGVGRMFAIESARSGAQVTIAARASSQASAQAVREEILRLQPGASVSTEAIQALHGPFDLLINATPCGMFPHTDEIPVDPALLSSVGSVFDCIYNPTQTKLLQAAQDAGCRTAGGMSMLVWQAVKAHEIWDGSHYEPAVITALTEEMIRLLAGRNRD